MKGFTVCVLVYGDFPELAKRCLNSIRRTFDGDLIKEIRIGMNDVCGETRRLVLDGWSTGELGVPVKVYDPGKNVFKYPLMRRMLHGCEKGPMVSQVRTEHVMWFDDDSCITADQKWWWRTYQEACRHTMLGDVWYVPYRGKTEWAEKQSWFAGKPFQKMRGQPAMKFATGGWWTAKYGYLFQWNYPWPQLKHRGGDCALGELLNQQGLTLGKYKEGLWINADENGKNSGAKRRGYDENPIWYDYKPNPDLAHQYFNLQVHELDG